MFTFIIGSFLWLTGASPAPGAPEILKFQSTNRVAARKAAQTLRFIPEAKLQEFAGASVSPNDRLSVGEHLDRFAATTVGCVSPVDGDVIGAGGAPPLPPAELVGTILRNNPVVIVGEVESLVPGWDVARERPATLVKFRILDVLSDPLRQYAPQRQLSYLADYGLVRVKGYQLCAADASMTPVHVGDHIIVAGLYDAANPSNVETSPQTTFFVRDEMVVPTKALEGGPPVAPLTLTDIRREMSRKKVTP